MNQEQNVEELIKQYGIMIKKIVMSIVKNSNNIDDIVQETYIKILENIDSIDVNRNIRSYICIIAMNTTKDYIRHISKSKELYCFDWNNLSCKENTSNDLYDVLEDGLKEYIDRLPLEYKLVIKCIYYNDMSIKEAAEYLGINQCTVKSRLYRGRKRLKVYIEKYNLCNC